MDNLSKEKRSYIMSRIRSKNTLPEILIRKSLFKKGYRYRIHYNLPGKPDIVFISKKIAIFINGCFWHGHGCIIDNNPETNTNFWNTKIKNNQKRDSDNYKNLKKMGWQYYICWECQILNNLEKEINNIKQLLV